MNWGKNASSRILRGQILQWAGSGTVVSTTFLPGTLQVRVISQINGYVAIDNTGTSISTSNFSAGTFIAANTANGDYFTVTPGQILEFTSTTTSSGGLVSVTDMG